MFVKGNISSHKYLGIIILDELQRHCHVREVKTKATNVSHCSSKVKEQAYNSLVRPRVEYAIPAWDPYEKQHIASIEAVQHNALWFVTGDYSRFEIQQCTVPQMREALGWETLECRRHLAAATTFYQSINNLIYLLAQVQNTPISSNTSPPTPMPTSTPSSPVQSLYGTISAYYSHPSLLTVLKPSKYMPCLSLEPSATLIDPWHLLFNITFIFVFSSIFWIIICAYISQL